MTALSLRGSAIVLIVAVVAALVACGSSHQTVVCPLSASSSCCPGTSPCAAPQYLYADGLNGQVSGFPVNSGAGLGTPVTVSGPQASLGMAAIGNAFLYASNPLSLSTGLIDGWSINIADGSLTSMPGSPFSIGPFSLAGGLAVNNVAQVLYVADAGKIDALKADATGALTPLAGSPFPAGSNIYLAADPGSAFLFAADNTGTGNVYAYTTDSTGALHAAPGSPFPLIPNSSTLTNPSQIVTDSTGSFVYVGLTGTNQVAAFSIVRSSGALNVVPGSPFTTGNFPFTLAATNKFLYVSNAMDGTLSAFSIDSTTGILTPLAGSPFSIRAGAMTADPSGQFLYVSGSGGMMAFSINSSTGALTEIGTPVPFAGATVLTYVR
jgi:hypothetical protein